MLKMLIEILEECQITLKWASRVIHDTTCAVVDTVMSIIIGK